MTGAFKAFLICQIFLASLLIAQNAGSDIPTPGRIGLPRFTEDYSVLKTIERNSLYYRLKYIPLGETSYLSLGGEARLRYEYFDNYFLGKAAQDNNGSILERYLLHADFHLNEEIRIFGQLVSLGAIDRDNPYRGLDKNDLDVNQLFAEYRSRSGFDFSIRAGRQEMYLGANRLFDYREGPNGRISFTGVRIDLYAPVQITLFYLSPGKINQGIFDDAPETNKKMIGVYSTFDNLIPGGVTDFYFIYNEYPQSNLINDGKRITAGAREAVTTGSFKVDAEAALQIAGIDDKGRSSLMLALDVNCKIIPANDFFNAGFISLYAGGAGDENHSTFNTFYPSGANFKSIDLFGKYNLAYFQPYIQFKPLVKDKLVADAIFCWRASVNDNVYYTPGLLFAKSGALNGSYLGVQGSVMYNYYWTDLLQTEIGCRVFWSSENMQSSGFAGRLTFLSAAVIYRF